MARSFSTLVKDYQDEMKNLSFVPKGSFGRSVVGPDGFPTTLFFGFLFSDQEKGITFLKECGLLKREMLCPTCGSNMSLWKSETNIVGGARKGSVASDATLYGASGTLPGLLKVN
jgi:hypothetical protein